MATRTRFDRDYYGLLELDPAATDEEIRRAYRRLALRWHPDRNPGNAEAEERFKAISEAYAVLVDPRKRGEYDGARRAGRPEGFAYRREDVFRDLFADAGASAVFEELAREFERMGMRVDRHYFHRTLHGGRAVVTGGIFVISPLTPVLALFQLGRAALRGARAVGAVGAEERPALPAPRGLGQRLVRAARWLWGVSPAPATAPARPGGADVTVPLRLSADEARRGTQKRVGLPAGAEIREVLVTVPPDTRSGTRLRLRGQGPPAPDGERRGDVYLAVDVDRG
jgi:DnaJ-class molecular chaperone